MRVIIAAIAGGIIVFVWSAVSHMVTPLGTMGISTLPNEDQVIESLRTNVPKSAVYLYPGVNMQAGLTPEEEKAWEDKVRRGPSGLLIHTAEGIEPAFPKQLGLELLAVILSSLIAAIVLTRTIGTWLSRAVIVSMFALFTFFSISASYWIWYRFPAEFIGAELVTEFVGYLLAGLAMAKIVPPPAA